jgi:glycosyltransferase involved in cell wall biosynthesis
MKRVALLADFVEEGWPSMDRVASSLSVHLDPEWTQLWRPSYQHFPGPRKVVRAWNRFGLYPWSFRFSPPQADVFHVLDHSYAHLVHCLPSERTVVTCHDVDAFRCLVEPAKEPRPWWFRCMTRHILSGLQKATRVICDSAATRDELVRHGLVEAARLRVVPLGVDDVFFQAWTARPPADGEIRLLHVGSTIPRKRIEFLLEVFAAIKKQYPSARLTRVGGDFTPAQRTLAEELGVMTSVDIKPALSNQELAETYARATVTLLPSSREGFGFPVVESLATGTPVVATDLPVLREVGGTAADYASGEDSQSWVQAISEIIVGGESRRAEYHAQGGLFSWKHCAAQVNEVYAELNV